MEDLELLMQILVCIEVMEVYMEDTEFLVSLGISHFTDPHKMTEDTN